MQKKAVRSVGMVVALLLMAVVSASGGNGGRPVFVPWKVLEPGIQPASGSLLMLYWIPESADQMRRSDLIMSSELADYAGRCVAMYVVRADDAARIAKLGNDLELPVALLIDSAGEVARVSHHRGALHSTAVEAMVRREVRRRQNDAERLLLEARRLAAVGEDSAAVAAYRNVASMKCAFPRLARSAERAIGKIKLVERSGRVGNAGQHP